MHQGIKSNSYGWDYKKFRKDYCENIDGRLGFVCTATIVEPMWQLDADHIDGDPTNNTEDNIQTLCKCCHAVKTKDSQDYLTDGRKTLKIMEAA
jgi:5-methylcytosine-specific restriction endonuclease McrA